jgi:hypothetical protein
MPPNNPPNSNTSLQPKSDQFSQLIDRLKSASNVLVTVSDSPSVDQLSACIGLTIALNKQGKHATAVFSGKIPSTLEFLQPERTIETNTNSLRDFIISLDKSKADKLKYKVEDDYVKIFITPYRTSISQDDLGFSQGDFNVDLIIMLGVHERQHLDGAIMAHGRILHDATIASLNTDTVSEIGTINWVESEASSLCEMASDLITQVDKSLLDSQIATALLTGMVAETDRFGNEKAHPHTMSVSGVLMAAGASPQLISSKLEESKPEPGEPGGEIPQVSEDEDTEATESSDGTLRIDHTVDQTDTEPLKPEGKEPEDDIKIDEHGKLHQVEDLHKGQDELNEDKPAPDQPGKIITEPPRLSGQLTANTIAEHDQPSPSTDPLSVGAKPPLLKRDEPQSKVPSVTPPQMPNDNQTLTDIEKSVNSHHLNNGSEPTDVPPQPVDDARSAVDRAMNTDDNYRPEPLNSVGATPVNLDLGHAENGQPPTPAGPAGEEPKPSESNSQNDKPPSSPPPVPPPFNPLGQ